ncbi:MAG: Ppx/GppA family phosphatase [Dehalococcoidia bacterium]|nr:Ppx/GppA family phosphatase [Dehalococcoidia bacterium]
MHSRVAAIDVGSNSMRIAVIETDGGAFLEVVQEARAVPRLIRDVRTTGRLSAASMERVLDVLREFLAIARSSSATDVAAVATSAVRDAANADELVATVRSQLGIELQVASGEEEARFAFLGALHSLPVTDGVLVDIGGGSAELVRFRGRAAESLLSLQLGAVRLTDDFLGNDPPTPEQLRALRKHLAREFSRAHLGRLKPGSQFVGTGGTVRNLAKIARVRYGHPLPHLHGYSLSRARLGELVSDLSGMPRAARLEIAGLNEDRAETIVAGALVIEALLESLDADELVVSGQGLREGVALAHAGGALLPVDALREAAVRVALERFAPDDGAASARRVRIAGRLAEALPPGGGDVAEMLPVAAALLDLGRGIDYYNRHRHTESILLARGLDGFRHREQALVGALVRLANSERYDPLTYAPLLTEADRPPLARAAALLQLADQLEQRLPWAAFGLHVEVDASAGVVRLTGDLPAGWDAGAARKRLSRAFGLNLVTGAGGGV